MFLSLIFNVYFSNLESLSQKFNEVSRYFVEFVIRNIYFLNYIFLLRSNIHGIRKGLSFDLFFFF